MRRPTLSHRWAGIRRADRGTAALPAETAGSSRQRAAARLAVASDRRHDRISSEDRREPVEERARGHGPAALLAPRDVVAAEHGLSPREHREVRVPVDVNHRFGAHRHAPPTPGAARPIEGQRDRRVSLVERERRGGASRRAGPAHRAPRAQRDDPERRLGVVERARGGPAVLPGQSQQGVRGRPVIDPQVDTGAAAADGSAIPQSVIIALGVLAAGVLAFVVYSDFSRRFRVRAVARAGLAAGGQGTEPRGGGGSFCRHCGGPVRPESAFCHGCGQEVRPLPGGQE